MLAGYALLLGEKQRTHINQGLVEYPRQALVRAVQIHSVDRARVLRLRDRIRQIKEGQLPDRPEDAPCHACWAAEICETRHSLLSKFF
jgi:CRISPR-associated exonuclease Cas4